MWFADLVTNLNEGGGRNAEFESGRHIVGYGLPVNYHRALGILSGCVEKLLVSKQTKCTVASVDNFDCSVIRLFYLSAFFDIFGCWSCKLDGYGPSKI